ncbi:MAG: helix-turn-helix domain-containing protein [Geobacter sp.]
MFKASERFKQIRNYLNLSQTEMSAKMGISKNAWQSYELGKSSPGIRSLFLTSSPP